MSRKWVKKVGRLLIESTGMCGNREKQWYGWLVLIVGLWVVLATQKPWQMANASTCMPVCNDRVNADYRVALVIGNSGYADKPLRNPPNDARDIGALLRETLGFKKVTVLSDLELKDFRRAVNTFLAESTEATIRVFYYSGHGASDGEDNYLLPIDHGISQAHELPDRAYPLNTLLRGLKKQKGVSLVFLDACRDAPFGDGKSIGSKGMKPMSPSETGTLIGYAADEGQTASDNSRGGNSLYTKHLLEQLHQPQKLREALQKVKDGVYAESYQTQLPMVEDRVVGEVYLNKPSSEPTTETTETQMIPFGQPYWREAWIWAALISLTLPMGLLIWRYRTPRLVPESDPHRGGAIMPVSDPYPAPQPPRYRLTCIEDAAQGFTFPNEGLEQEPGFVLGREDPADWLIPLDSISRRHARVFRHEEAWWIEDLESSNGTRLNAARLVPYQAQRLHPHDRVMLADLVFCFDRAMEEGQAMAQPGSTRQSITVTGADGPPAIKPPPNPRSTDASSPAYRLTGIEDAAQGFNFPSEGLEQEPGFVLGREDPADWLIALDSISRCHARVFWHEQAWWIEDLKSSNGTYLNATRLTPYQAQRLQSQDRVTLGKVSLRFESRAADNPTLGTL